MPRLAGVPAAAVESFRRQVEMVDRRGETSLDGLRALVSELLGLRYEQDKPLRAAR